MIRVAFCSSEVFPFAKTGGLADVCGTLPYHLASNGIAVDIFTPYYRSVKDAKVEIFPCDNLPAYVTHLNDNIRIFFISHSNYFDRQGLYGNEQGDYEDNFERFSYFCYCALHVMEELPDKYDAIHCHDWQTGLIPTILKTKPFDYQKLRSANVVFTIHNLAYQGLFSGDLFHKLKLPDYVFSMDGIEFYDQICFLKGGIAYADTVTTVSQQYAQEIQTKKFGCGLEGVLKKRGVVGILNGLDYDYWNPDNDQYLKYGYNEKNILKKKQLKKELQKKLNLPVNDSIPVFGFVGRLSHQKGIDLLIKSIPALIKHNIQLVIVGTGSEEYEKKLNLISKEFSQHIALFLAFGESMAHYTYAGSDFFLMPSTYEPCGLTQMIALRYGTIPIVSKTGGLVDTIIDHQQNPRKSNGFIIDKYTIKAFNQAVERALLSYHNPKKFSLLQQRAFRCRYTWEESAKKYKEIYCYDSSRVNR